MSQKFERLKTLLKELFQLDQPDLDFGLYRIMHAKSAEVTQFLDEQLLPQVKEAFALYKSADKSEVEKELAQVVAGIQAAGMDPEQSPKVKELRAKLKEDSVDVTAMESEVYDHLFSFFRRYYSEGDFLSKRVYKPGVYAIPYEGEEVKLHWANADQYYIKTSEYLRDYTFRLRPDDDAKPMRVHFRLVDAAEGEHGNVKEAQGKERRFKLAGTDPVGLVDGEFCIRFTYQPNAGKQKDLNTATEAAVLAAKDSALAEWLHALRAPHIRTDGSEAGTRLRVHLDRYTARNTFDYFIHKDLGGFLRRELDFYIKNEVMHLDDVENESAARVEQYLSKIRIIRRIAVKIADFLAQIEEFQKNIWTKRKFIIGSSWCMRLDYVPEALYAEVMTNESQRKEWLELFALDEIPADLMHTGYKGKLTTQFLKANPSLVLDTRHFSAPFVDRLLGSLSDLDAQVDAVLWQGENSQALSLLYRRFHARINSLYIDPPYNTDASEINYKNGYRHSSWLALVDDRLKKTTPLLKDDAVLCITIDDVEVHNLRTLADSTLAQYDVLGVVPIKNNPAGRTGTVGFSVCHEYALFYGLPGEARIARLEHSEAQKARYKERDEISAYEWTNFRKHGGQNTYRTARPRQEELRLAYENALSILSKMPVQNEIFTEEQSGELVNRISGEVAAHLGEQ